MDHYRAYVDNHEAEANRVEADRRAKEAANDDPFPQVPAALLSSEHIQAYVRQTAMVHPFYPDRRDAPLKAASYEMRPGGMFVRWDEGEKHVQPVGGGIGIVLPPNSISFVQLESRIRLPNYVAIRFNLRIKHVHRGILLGTGPLVDPGFHGQLLIPLHNLTSAPYTIEADEGLIWVEFTKTSWSAGSGRAADVGPVTDAFRETGSAKTDRPVEFYFEKANRNRPIQSSIPDALRTARDSAEKARTDADAAKKANQFFAGLGLLAVLSLVVSLYSFLQTADSNLRTAGERSLMATDDAKSALDAIGKLSARMVDPAALAAKAGPDATALERELATLKQRLDRLETEVGHRGTRE